MTLHLTVIMDVLVSVCNLRLVMDLLTLHLTVIMDVLVSVCRLRLAMDSNDTTFHSNHGCVSFCL